MSGSKPSGRNLGQDARFFERMERAARSACSYRAVVNGDAVGEQLAASLSEDR